MSDVHLEFGSFKIPKLESDSETILLLAGDIHVGDRVHRDDWMKEVSEQFAYVLYVLGNHEHYRSSLDRTATKIRLTAEKQGITNLFVLENETFEIPGTNWKVFGGTMWTDFNKGNPLTMFDAKENMSDYKLIRTNMYARRLTPNWVAIQHLLFKQALLAELTKPYDGNVIVMTHHAPHSLSCDPIYANDYHGNGAYASDLSDLILDHPQIKHWFHGHIHYNSDYTIGDCNVHNNPRGYYDEKLNDDFDSEFVLKL